MIPTHKLIEIACQVTGVNPHDHVYDTRTKEAIYSRYLAIYLLGKYRNIKSVGISELYNTQMYNVGHWMTKYREIMSDRKITDFYRLIDEADEICRNIEHSYHEESLFQIKTA